MRPSTRLGWAGRPGRSILWKELRRFSRIGISPEGTSDSRRIVFSPGRSGQASPSAADSPRQPSHSSASPSLLPQRDHPARGRGRGRGRYGGAYRGIRCREHSRNSRPGKDNRDSASAERTVALGQQLPPLRAPQPPRPRWAGTADEPPPRVRGVVSPTPPPLFPPWRAA